MFKTLLSNNIITNTIRKTALSRTFSKLKSKVLPSAEQAVKDIVNGSQIGVGGFGLCGQPLNLIQAILDKGSQDLRLITNYCGKEGVGLSTLLEKKRVSKVMASFVGKTESLEEQYLNGELELDFTPQGTLAEMLKAGSSGIPAFYTRTGVGTIVQTGDLPVLMMPGGRGIKKFSSNKQVREFDGQMYILQRSVRPQFSLIKAKKADKIGNAVFNKSAQNFNPDFGAAGQTTILQAEQIVEVGQIDPQQVQLPQIYVDRVVLSKNKDKPIEQVLHSSPSGIVDIPGTPERKKKKELIARRAAMEIEDGMNVNLGVGIPTIAAGFVNPDYTIYLQSQNGLLGIGPYPADGEQDPDLVGAGNQTITIKPGGSYFSSSESFKMIRGGHLDLTILGALQVSESGDLANWIIPGKIVKGMGGAMDLVSCKSRVIVTMQHCAKNAPKFLKRCTLPLTGKRVVNELITDLGFFVFEHGFFQLREIADGYDVESIKAVTEGEFHVADNLKPMRVDGMGS